MELNNLNIDFITASWFLLTLFYKTERKYTCTKDKILNLLTIVALDYACSGDKIFNEDILLNDNNEPYINGLLGLSKYEYIKLPEQKDNKEYINEILDETKDNLVPFMYRCNVVDDELKEKTINVFRNFGAYPQEELGTMVSSVVNKMTTKEETLDLTKVSSVIDTIEETNDIVKYLQQKHLCNANKNNKRLIKR